jgi:tricarballylate dehydrogenase
VTRRIYEQPGGMAWVVLDARHLRIPNYKLALRTDKPPVVADSIAALAQAIAVPADALALTLADYNAACSGQD